MKLKWLVVNQENHINQEKMVGVQPKYNRYSDVSIIEESKISNSDPFNNILSLHLMGGGNL
jgi:hypothetical protein